MPSKSGTRIDLEKLAAQYVRRVERHGDIEDIANWRKAFAGEIEEAFPDIDVGLTGRPIEWEKRTLLERVAYVCYMTNLHQLELKYELIVGGEEGEFSITDSEIMWYVWFYGAFKEIEPRNAIQALAEYAIAPRFDDMRQFAAQMAESLVLNDSIVVDTLELHRKEAVKAAGRPMRAPKKAPVLKVSKGPRTQRVPEKRRRAVSA